MPWYGQAGDDKTAADAQSSAELIPGNRLGHYVIRRKLGAGGMGQVYEAVDEKLHRTVAIKILPLEHTAGAHARRRFQQEAQSAWALNHPNIVTVYEVGQKGDIDFLAMERIDGRTLHDIIGGHGLDGAEVFAADVRSSRW